MLAVAQPAPISTMKAASVLAGPSTPSTISTPIAPALISPVNLPQVFHHTDPVYGSFAISEPILIELILSGPMQRLKHVLQHGITGLIGLPPTPSPPVTRYNHSLGAMLLVRMAGGTLEAQAAALLHDVAHTALSHVVDGVFDYVVHEVDKMEYLDTTTVPHIIKKHGFNPDRVLEEANFPLLELDAPAICADRLDYGIRDAVAFGYLTIPQAVFIAQSLQAAPSGRFCFSNVKAASMLARAYMKCDEAAWGNPTHSLLYTYAANTIKLAHTLGALRKADLWAAGDEVFWRSMTESSEATIRESAAKVNVNVRVELVDEANSKPDQDCWYRERAKLRTIDPDVLNEDGQGVKKLSELDPDYDSLRRTYLASHSGYKVYKITHGQ